jgi:hypothetical protein
MKFDIFCINLLIEKNRQNHLINFLTFEAPFEPVQFYNIARTP